MLKTAHPDEVQLLHTLHNKYRDVLFAYPHSARPGHDSALGAWLSQWEEALGNLFDQGDAELDERKWLNEFALNFNSWWPRIASRANSFNHFLSSSSASPWSNKLPRASSH